MIIYFTGTGNSRYVAEGLAQILEDKLVSATDLIKFKNNDTFNSEKPFVFVGPIYAGRYPKVFRKFIKESMFLGPRNAYVVATCAGSPGDAYGSIQTDLKKVGLGVKGFSYVLMPNNYLLMFDTPSKEEADDIVAKGREKTIEIANKIKNGEAFVETPGGAKNKFVSVFGYQVANASFKSKKFKASDKCNACGTCTFLCPFESIHLIDNKPVWKGKCTHCMACISACPNEAIEYGKKTKGRNRHYLKDKF
ncbi:MAG: EFR1 family ferrodoxin [Methanobacteriaceae archaeon]|nr:EFR1 family ferrodoxin [Methanobacteriaceae archaeon]